MNKTLRAVLATVLSALLLLGVTSQTGIAQQYTISNTTLSGAVTATQNTMVLASASASTGSSFGAPVAQQCYYVDGELGRITSISSTTITVQRPTGTGNNPGFYATGPAPHANAAVIWTAPCNAFKQALPLGLSGGNQICSAQPAPWIDTKDGIIGWCNTNTNKWTLTTYVTSFTYGSVPTAQ